jgi:hypothetical protein
MNGFSIDDLLDGVKTPTFDFGNTVQLATPDTIGGQKPAYITVVFPNTGRELTINTESNNNLLEVARAAAVKLNAQLQNSWHLRTEHEERSVEIAKRAADTLAFITPGKGPVTRIFISPQENSSNA